MVEASPIKNRICLCLGASTMRQNLALLRGERYFDAATDYAEIRLDFLLDFTAESVLQASAQQLCRELQELDGNLPDRAQFILTLRKQADGGLCRDKMPDEEYLELLQKFIVALPAQHLAYIDLDAPLLQRQISEETGQLQPALQDLLHSLQAAQGQLIISVHHFGALPQSQDLQAEWTELQNLQRRLNGAQGDGMGQTVILKLAVMVGSSEELLRFFQFGRNLPDMGSRHVLLAMGEFGSCSRILAPHLRSEWTFCRPSDSVAVALGQFTLTELEELYGYRQLNESSAIYGVIGDPVGHSHSPQLHNPVYQKKGWNALYLRFRVDVLENFLALTDTLPIRGISCTVPHKERLAHLAASGQVGEKVASASAAVRLLGASNTFFRMREQTAVGERWHAENTDIQGFIQPLLEFCQRRGVQLKGRKAAVIGAGGAARAAVYALLYHGVDCEIYNRTEQKALQLQTLFNSAGQQLSGEPFAEKSFTGHVRRASALEQGRNISANCDLLIQTTSVGMYQQGQNTEGMPLDPVPAYSFRPGQLAYDLIYQPEQTVFLLRAAAAGAMTLNGSAMLEKQAMAQIDLFASQRNF